MGIGQAISRVKDGVRRAGLEGVVAGLGVQLRSAAIPSALRPAAQKLADLLAMPAQQPVVSLDASIAAHEATSVSHAELAAGGGVCPFTGANAGLAALLDASQFEAPAFEVVHTEDAVEPLDAQFLEAETAQSMASETSSIEVAPKLIAPNSLKARRVAKPSVKRVGLVKAGVPEKKSPSVSEKEPEKVAARPATSKTPARSTASTSKIARPAARRPVAKAVRKKD